MKKLFLTLSAVLLLAAACNTQPVATKPNNQQIQKPETVANKPAQQIQKTDDKIADWKTYTNKKLGFSIKYPPTGWKIEESNKQETGADVRFHYTDSSSLDGRESLRVDTTNKTLAQWISSLVTNSSPSDITIDAQKAIKVYAPGFASDVLLIGVSYKGKFYEFNTNGKIIDSGMLATFKFIK